MNDKACSEPAISKEEIVAMAKAAGIKVRLDHLGFDSVVVATISQLKDIAIAAQQAALNRRAPEVPEVPEVPEGWKLVPVESTWEMDHEGMLSLPDDCHDSDAERCYRAMIAAAPQPPKDTE